MHTTYSDGKDTLETMVSTAETMDYEYMLITDHSRTDETGMGLSIKKLREQGRKIDELSRKHVIKILKGIEVDILADGTLDYPDEILKHTHVTVASIHRELRQSKVKMTDRIVSALENKFVDIVGHPTAYYRGDFKAIDANWDKIFDVAAQNKKILEINSQPNRLDLNEKNIKRAKEFGVKFAISTDAHSREELGYIVVGVNLANRAGLTTRNVVNSLPLSELKKVFTRIPKSL